MFPAPHEKLQHLSAEQMDQLKKDYYEGQNVASLIQHYQIKCHAKGLWKLFPPEITEDTCSYCNVLLYKHAQPRSNIWDSTLAECLSCGHSTGPYCQCKQCVKTKKTKEEAHQEALNQRRLAIRAQYRAPENFPSIDPSQLSLKEAVFLLSLYAHSYDEDSNLILPINGRAGLSPTPELDREIIYSLINSDLLWINPESGMDAFIFENESLTDCYYPGEVSCLLMIGKDRAESLEFMKALCSIVKNADWPVNWREDTMSLWSLLSLHECLAILEDYANQYDLVAPARHTAELLFENLLKNFSVSQIQYILLKSTKDALAYRTNKGISKKDAGDLILKYCKILSEKAQINSWELQSFNRCSSCPRSTISHVFHDFFLGNGEQSYYQPISSYIVPNDSNPAENADSDQEETA